MSFTAARDSSHKSIEQSHSNVSINSSGVFGRGVRHGVPTAWHYETPRWCPPPKPPPSPTGADGKPAHMARAQRALTTGHTRPLAQSQWQRFGLGQSLSQWHCTASGSVWAAATRRRGAGEQPGVAI